MPEPDADTLALEQAANGNADALESLLENVMPRLRAALSISPTWSRSFDLDDVLQVTFIEAFLRIRTLENRTPEGFFRWLKRIADNNVKDAIRSLERDRRPDPRRRVTEGPKGETSRTLLCAVAGDAITAGSQAAMKEGVERMHAAIGKLPKSYRTVIEEVDLGGRPVAEVAVDLDRSRGAVHMLRSRAHDRLRELLSQPTE